MSRFYGSLTGSARTTATRRGTPSSGVSAHVRGWNFGVRVAVLDIDGEDHIILTATGGSRGNMQESDLGEWRRVEDTIERVR